MEIKLVERTNEQIRGKICRQIFNLRLKSERENGYDRTKKKK